MCFWETCSLFLQFFLVNTNAPETTQFSFILHNLVILLGFSWYSFGRHWNYPIQFPFSRSHLTYRVTKWTFKHNDFFRIFVFHWSTKKIWCVLFVLGNGKVGLFSLFTPFIYNIIYCESMNHILKPREFRSHISSQSSSRSIGWNAVSRCSFAQCLHCSSPLTCVSTVYATHPALLKLLPVFSLSFWDIITLLYPSLLAFTSLFSHPPSAASWLICSFYINFMMNHWHE